MHRTSALLSAVLEAQRSAVAQLPTEDVRVGAYRFDAAERGRPLGQLFAHLEALYMVGGRWVWGCDACRPGKAGCGRARRSINSTNRRWDVHVHVHACWLVG